MSGTRPFLRDLQNKKHVSIWAWCKDTNVICARSCLENVMLTNVNYISDAEHHVPSGGIEGEIDAGVLSCLIRNL